jgi:hypothetical protein
VVLVGTKKALGMVTRRADVPAKVRNVTAKASDRGFDSSIIVHETRHVISYRPAIGPPDRFRQLRKVGTQPTRVRRAGIVKHSVLGGHFNRDSINPTLLRRETMTTGQNDNLVQTKLTLAAKYRRTRHDSEK